MKKILFTLFAASLLQSAHAQQYIIVNGETPVLASDVEKITYEDDNQFESSLLDSRLATDAKTRLFSQALQLTGLADTLKAYWRDYQCDCPDKYYYKTHMRNSVAYYNKTRPIMFTVFAETDDVYAAQGINNINDLKAYAKQIYDAEYPEDANISDPANRRNSLNRFVAYHILGHDGRYFYLTGFDGDPTQNMLSHFFNRDLADIAAWYATLMPGASLKCSYPDAGEETGLYLNRRGLKNGPDKYGIQVRGAMIMPDDSIFEHKAFNGYYYYIDRILTYDQETRDVVLGGERWRVDAKTLSPDIMNVYERRKYSPPMDDVINPLSNKNIIFAWDAIENFSNTIDNPGLIVNKTNWNYYSFEYELDFMNIVGEFDMTIKLPPLPSGEWEVRWGHNAIGTDPNVKVWLNGNVAIDSLSLSDHDTENDTRPYKLMKGPREFRLYDGCSTYGQSLSDFEYSVRVVLGRIQSDGKSDNYLRMKALEPDKLLMIDYLEFCPASVCDNQEIPEE